MSKIFKLILIQALCTYANATPLVAIDSGHTPSAPGAIGSCGQREVDYNDETVRVLALKLKPDYNLLLTRAIQQEVAPKFIAPVSFIGGVEPRESLLKRGEIANQAGAQIFISIHHDSTEDQYLVFDPAICN